MSPICTTETIILPNIFGVLFIIFIIVFFLVLQWISVLFVCYISLICLSLSICVLYLFCFLPCVSLLLILRYILYILALHISVFSFVFLLCILSCTSALGLYSIFCFRLDSVSFIGFETSNSIASSVFSVVLIDLHTSNDNKHIYTKLVSIQTLFHSYTTAHALFFSSSTVLLFPLVMFASFSFHNDLHDILYFVYGNQFFSRVVISTFLWEFIFCTLQALTERCAEILIYCICSSLTVFVQTVIGLVTPVIIALIPAGQNNRAAMRIFSLSLLLF